MRGRKAHPTAVRIHRGNPGRRPLNPYEPQHPDIDPGVPPQLTDALAIAEWSRVIDLLSHGHVTQVDRATLIGYCQKYAQWQALEAEAARHPWLVKTPSGYPMPNPALSMANKAFALMLKAAVELGITPSSRSRIVALPQQDSGTVVDEFTAFQRKRRAG